MSLPNKDEIKGRLNQARGAAKEKLGQAAGDPVTAGQGTDERIGGKVQAGFGKGRRKAGDAIEDLGKKLKR